MIESASFLTCIKASGIAIATTPKSTRHPHHPGEDGIWIIVFIDLSIFSALFVNFAWFRTRSPDRYLGELTALDQQLGALNTIILLISSWLVVMAIAAARQRRLVIASRLFLGAAGCGAVFFAIKIFEYQENISHGITIDTNLFYSYYFVLTGLHLAHLLVGVSVLIWLRSKVLALDLESGVSALESGAIFWHMIDLIWLVLFPLLYLMSAPP